MLRNGTLLYYFTTERYARAMTNQVTRDSSNEETVGICVGIKLIVSSSPSNPSFGISKNINIYRYAVCNVYL